MVKVDQTNCHGWLIYFNVVRLGPAIDINLNCTTKTMTVSETSFCCSQINVNLKSSDFQGSI